MNATAEATNAPDAHQGPKKKRGGGPRTPEGRERAKRNSLQHALTAESVIPEELAIAAAKHTTNLIVQYDPKNDHQLWLVGEMGLAQAKLDRCAEMIPIDLQRSKDRAVLCWDDDRQVEIEDIGVRLIKDPKRVSKTLRQSKQGIDWLLYHWAGLSDILETNGGWNEGQRRLAFDLLGVPNDLREGSRQVPAESDLPGLTDLVETQITTLQLRQDVALFDLDDAARAMAVKGLNPEVDATTKRLRKYEGQIRGTLNRALAELLRVQAEGLQGQAQAQAEAAKQEQAKTGAAPSSSWKPSSAMSPRPLPAIGSMEDGKSFLEFAKAAGLRSAVPQPPPAPAPEPAVDLQAPVVETVAPEVAEVAVTDEVAIVAEAAAITAPPVRSTSTFFKSPMATLGSQPRNRHERRAQEQQARKGTR